MCCCAGGSAAGAGGREGAAGRVRAGVAAALVAMLLGGYALRTLDRNWDWEDEERLFRAAFRVRSPMQ